MGFFLSCSGCYCNKLSWENNKVNHLFSDIISFSQLQHHFAHPVFSQLLLFGLLELDVLQWRCYLFQNFLSAPATDKHILLIQAASPTCFLVHDLKAPLRIFAPWRRWAGGCCPALCKTKKRKKNSVIQPLTARVVYRKHLIWKL